MTCHVMISLFGNCFMSLLSLSRGPRKKSDYMPHTNIDQERCVFAKQLS